MSRNVTITKEIPGLPSRSEDAHKGDVGRIVVIGGCDGPVTMIGAAALTANGAYRCGAGLVQIVAPRSLLGAIGSIAPCCTLRSLTDSADSLLTGLAEFNADVVALGPGLGDSISADTLQAVLSSFDGFIVLDADGLNLLASNPSIGFTSPQRVVMTPHPGEMRRLLDAHEVGTEAQAPDRGFAARRDAAFALVDLYHCTVVFKGRHSIVTNGQRLFVNETGNAGMASGGTGDVLTGMVAALIGQSMAPLEAAILATYLHGLAGDFAAEELGRHALTATDLIEYLPEAICEYESAPLG